MTDEIERKTSEAGSVAGSEHDTEEKPEVEEKEKLLNDEDRTDKTSHHSVKIMTEDHLNKDLENNDLKDNDLEDNDPPAKKNEDDDEKVPFYKSLWFIILMSGQLSSSIDCMTQYDLWWPTWTLYDFKWSICMIIF